MTIESRDKYIESHKRDYMTTEFAYASYNPPNTMYYVSNQLDDILLSCSGYSMKLWHMIMSRVKRNTDPVKAITVSLSHNNVKDHMCRNTYFKSLRELIDKNLVHSTTSRGIYVVNISYANKLYKPKLDIID